MKMSSTLNIYKHLQQENNANYVYLHTFFKKSNKKSEPLNWFS